MKVNIALAALRHFMLFLICPILEIILELLSNSLSGLNIIFYDPFAQVSISGKEKDIVKKHKNKSVIQRL